MHDLLHGFLHELLHSLEFLIGLDGVHMLEDFLHEFFELAFLFLMINFFVRLLLQRVSKERLHSLLGGGKSYLAAALLGAATPFCTSSNCFVILFMTYLGIAVVIKISIVPMLFQNCTLSEGHVRKYLIIDHWS